jgi:hypothetical protein
MNDLKIFTFAVSQNQDPMLFKTLINCPKRERSVLLRQALRKWINKED